LPRSAFQRGRGPGLSIWRDRWRDEKERERDTLKERDGNRKGEIERE
jgi:hypothetical protein